MNASAAIVRIIEVCDTRAYEEINDRWVPIPGSGNIRECTRCGREHEIHATVELDNGTTEVVGTGCAARATMHLAAAFRSGEARAKRVASLRAQIARLERLANEGRAIRAEVAAQPVPAVTHRQMGERRYEFACGDATVWGFNVEDAKERFDCARNAWCRKRCEERGFTYKHDHAAIALATARKALAKATA